MKRLATELQQNSSNQQKRREVSYSQLLIEDDLFN